jgi:diguanylate cyclase (GGDEF)-like protein
VRRGNSRSWTIRKRVATLVTLPVLLSVALLGAFAFNQGRQAQTAADLRDRLELALALGAVPGTAETERGLSNGSVALGLLAGSDASSGGPFASTNLSTERAAARSRLDRAVDPIDRSLVSPELSTSLAELDVLRERLDQGEASIQDIQTYFDELIEFAAIEADTHLTWTVANLGSVGAEELAPELGAVRSLNELSERGAVWTSQAHAGTFARNRETALELAISSDQQVQLIADIEAAYPSVVDLPEWQSVSSGGERRERFLDELLWGSSAGAFSADQLLNEISDLERQASQDVYLVGRSVAAEPLAELGDAAIQAEQISIAAAAAAAALVLAAGAGAVHVVRSVARPLDELQFRAERISAGELGWSPNRGNDPAEVVAINRGLDDLVRVLLTVQDQAEALAAGDLEAEVLSECAPGPLGEALSGSVDQLRSATTSLRYSESEARTVIDSAAEAILVVGMDGGILRCNSAAEQAIGADRVASGSAEGFLPQWRKLKPGSHETTMVDAAGQDMHLLVSSSVFSSDEGPVTVLIWRDISDRKLNERTLVHQARHDHLTGLLNRAGLLGLLDDRVVAGIPSAIAYLDLDRFKPVNDLYGHEAGDHVLREVGRRLHATVRGSDAVARIGGDEFVVLSDGDSDDVERMAERLVEAVSRPIDLPGGEIVRLGASVGWAGSDTVSAGELLRRADVALYLAKSSEDISVTAYTEQVASQDAERRSIETELRNAIETGELRLHGQPIVDLATGKTVGVEALVRWEHPDRGLIPPGLFVPVAERSDLILDLDRWVLSEAISIAAKQPPEGPRISVNVSGRHLRSPELAETIGKLLDEHRCPANRIQIEMTETHEGIDSDAALVTVNRLRARGITVALDDFGTGYSSLTHLLRLPIDAVKIDRSMVSVIDKPEGSSIVDAIIGYCHAQNLLVVAEGVETAEQERLLQERGCGLAQGYYYSKPKPIETFLLVSQAN